MTLHGCTHTRRLSAAHLRVVCAQSEQGAGRQRASTWSKPAHVPDGRAHWSNSGGEGGDSGVVDGGKQSSQPAKVTLPSVNHWIGVPSGTTPSGEPLPQYRAPFTVRWSNRHDDPGSTSNDVTEIGNMGGLVIVQASLLE